MIRKIELKSVEIEIARKYYCLKKIEKIKGTNCKLFRIEYSERTSIIEKFINDTIRYGEEHNCIDEISSII